jgi:hypothetical protein
LVVEIGVEIRHERAVLDVLDEAGAEDRRGNPEDDVAVADLGLEVLLPDVAAAACGFPVITKSACTPPSREPSELNWKRASRIGPFGVMKDGMTLPVNLRSPVTLNSGF